MILKYELKQKSSLFFIKGWILLFFLFVGSLPVVLEISRVERTCSLLSAGNVVLKVLRV